MLALHLELAAQQLGELASQMQSQSRSLAAIRAIDLRERREQARLVLDTDSGPRVHHGNLDSARSGAPQRNPDTSPFRELDRVVREVEDDLAQCAPIGPQRKSFYRHGELELGPFRLGLGTQRRGPLDEPGLAGGRRGLQLAFSRLDLGEVEEVVDEGEE